MSRTHPLFILDANIFMEACNRYYSRDICPGFWECLEYYCQEGRVISVDRVRDEIRRSGTLDEWVDQAPGKLFAVSSEQPVTGAYKEIIGWVQGNRQFLPASKAKFARGADGWVAAYAKVHDAVVVSHEAFSQDVKKKVPLPNVCRQFGIAYKDAFEMLRELEAAFEWTRPAA